MFCRHAKDPGLVPYNPETDREFILEFLKAEKSPVETGHLETLKKPDIMRKHKPSRQHTETREPAAIVCIDEARGLLDYQHSANSPFRFFRGALAKCWEGPREKAVWYNPMRDYFAGVKLFTICRPRR
jgi:hypothetical protein